MYAYCKKAFIYKKYKALYALKKLWVKSITYILCKMVYSDNLAIEALN
jgi:hypothetical protein